jgi:cytochrome b561
MTEPVPGRLEEDHTILLLLCYLGILALIPYLVCAGRRSDPKMDFAFRHARQGLALAILVMVASALLLFGTVLLGGPSEVGAVAVRIGWASLFVLAAAASVTGWFKAFTRRPWVLPAGGRFAERWL